MGLRDTADQLDACRAQSVTDETRIAQLERELANAGEGLAAAATLIDLLMSTARSDAAVRDLLDSGAPISRPVLAATLDDPPPGTYLTADEAQLAVRACRHSAASIREIADIDPTRLHPDVAPYAARLDTLADRLTREATR